MLARERDWCHEDLDVDLPGWMVETARAAGLRWQGLTFSYLVLRRDATRSVAELLASEPGERALVPLRMVSAPRATKGKTEAFTSGAVPDGTGGARLMQLDRDARAAKREGDEPAGAGGSRPGVLLADLARGDVVGVEREALARGEPGRPVRVKPAEIAPPRRG